MREKDRQDINEEDVRTNTAVPGECVSTSLTSLFDPFRIISSSCHFIDLFPRYDEIINDVIIKQQSFFFVQFRLYSR